MWGGGGGGGDNTTYVDIWLTKCPRVWGETMAMEPHPEEVCRYSCPLHVSQCSISGVQGSMLRPWSTRTSTSRCGTLAVRTRSDLCGDITFKTHRYTVTTSPVTL